MHFLFILSLATAWGDSPLLLEPMRLREVHGKTAELDGHRVFVKMTGFGARPCADTLHEAEMAQLISPTGIGPRFYGRLDIPRVFSDAGLIYQYGLVFEFVEGRVLRAHLATDEDENPIDGADMELEEGAVIRPHTLEQVERAFAVLAELRIEAADTQFLITKDGDARLIDYGLFVKRRTIRSARKQMRLEREALIDGLRQHLGH